MTLLFVTSNRGKFEETRKLMALHSIAMEQAEFDFIEPDFDTLKEIAEYKCRQAYEAFQKPVAVDDTGFFFEAFDGFPGVHTSWVFKKIGFEGLFRLLEGKERKAHATTLCCFTFDGKEYFSFTGTSHGHILDHVVLTENPLAKTLPYAQIFFEKSRQKPLIDFSPEEIHETHHRCAAFTRLAQHIHEQHPSLLKRCVSS